MATTPMVISTGVPLPPPPQTDPLSPEAWGIIAALADAIVPSITNAKGNPLLQQSLRPDAYDAARRHMAGIASIEPDSELLTRYMTESVTAQPEFKECLSRLMAEQLDADNLNSLLLVFNALR